MTKGGTPIQVEVTSPQNVLQNTKFAYQYAITLNFASFSKSFSKGAEKDLGNQYFLIQKTLLSDCYLLRWTFFIIKSQC